MAEQFDKSLDPDLTPEGKAAMAAPAGAPTLTPDPRHSLEPASALPARSATDSPVQDLNAAVVPQRKTNSVEGMPSPADADSPKETSTAALTPPKAEKWVAILLVREEIKSVSDLASKTIAVDGSQSDSVSEIKAAIAKAGIKDVRISEDKKFALGRLMDGEVSGGVISVVSPEETATWTGVPGYTVLRLPLVMSPKAPDPG